MKNLYASRFEKVLRGELVVYLLYTEYWGAGGWSGLCAAPAVRYNMKGFNKVANAAAGLDRSFPWTGPSPNRTPPIHLQFFTPNRLVD